MPEFSYEDTCLKYNKSVALVSIKGAPPVFRYVYGSNGSIVLYDQNQKDQRFSYESLDFHCFRFKPGWYPLKDDCAVRLTRRLDNKIYQMGLNTHTFRFDGPAGIDELYSVFFKLDGTFDNPNYTQTLKYPGVLSRFYYFDGEKFINLFKQTVAILDKKTQTVFPYHHNEFEIEFVDLFKRNNNYGEYRLSENR